MDLQHGMTMAGGKYVRCGVVGERDRLGLGEAFCIASGMALGDLEYRP